MLRRPRISARSDMALTKFDMVPPNAERTLLERALHVRYYAGARASVPIEKQKGILFFGGGLKERILAFGVGWSAGNRV